MPPNDPRQPDIPNSFYPCIVESFSSSYELMLKFRSLFLLTSLNESPETEIYSVFQYWIPEYKLFNCSRENNIFSVFISRKLFPEYL